MQERVTLACLRRRLEVPAITLITPSDERMSKSFEIKNPATGLSTALPVRTGTIGPEVLDIANLAKDQGVFTFDLGYSVTASCDSKITYIDGDVGILLYRGYPVEQLAEKSNFMEVAYLLIHGELPSTKQLQEFSESITRHTMINESLLRFFNGFYNSAHPMAMVSAVVASMSAFYHDSMDIYNPRHREIFSHRIIAKIPTIAAAAHKHALGQPFVYPRNDLDYCSNMLNMFFSVPCEPYEINPIAAKALDLLFVLRPTTSRTPVPRLCGSRAARAPIPTRPSQPGWRRCGARRMAAPMRQCWPCSSRSARSRTFRNTWRWPRTRAATSGSWASGIGSIRTLIRAQRSSARPATRCSRNSGGRTARCSSWRCAWRKLRSG